MSGLQRIFPDEHALDKLDCFDETCRSYATRVAEQIAQLSSGMTLHPGDIILTGKPAGVGSARGEFLKPGDFVRIWIEKIGTLTNKLA